ncbi:PrpF domain-containing protein [Halalkalicoccus sp. NIPERK01]|uniref:PrpF domain-containing protein n=1 Tax=Halalkalicoccus sp. NIPERK01 TaxID=3053469 RepID=UPI00256EC98F|nr:PrpF domain-containing protein [Halalkalicoccus sp. NIPERK01]MDL5363453.1 PrpF domain-containing protein [Halalkalicoccus sp. NIPERK01]
MPNPESTLQRGIEGRLIRGGTSKGFFADPAAFPADPTKRDEVVLELFGSPDPLQVDGLGGSHTHTSKLMLVDEGDRSDVDLAYRYAQVGIDEATVDWDGNCGNLASAVGVYGLLDGLVEPTEPTTTVRIYSENTDSLLEQDVPVAEGEPTPYGTRRIDGVPGSGARIPTRYLDPCGGMLGAALPTGEPTDELVVDGESYTVSIVDATNVTVFLRAGALGLDGTELPAAIEADAGLLDRLERIRAAACVELGLVDDPERASIERPTMPFVALVSPPRGYATSIEGRVDAAEIDITARMVSTGRPHHAYATTGAMCLAAATRLPGTIPADVARGTGDAVRIGHPKGTIRIGVDARSTGPSVRSVSIDRTARLLMAGTAFVRDPDRI